MTKVNEVTNDGLKAENERLQAELSRAAEILQSTLGIGAVKAIGLLEVAAGVEQLKSLIDKHLHVRKCWDCSEVFHATSGLILNCMCPKCGSHDTRKPKGK